MSLQAFSPPDPPDPGSNNASLLFVPRARSPLPLRQRSSLTYPPPPCDIALARYVADDRISASHRVPYQRLSRQSSPAKLATVFFHGTSWRHTRSPSMRPSTTTTCNNVPSNLYPSLTRSSAFYGRKRGTLIMTSSRVQHMSIFKPSSYDTP